MSTKNRVILHEWNVPALNAPGYADDLHEAFTVIEKNQALLANSDLWKGDKGDSVRIANVDLSQDSVLLTKLKAAILKGHSSSPRPINNIRWDNLLTMSVNLIFKVTDVDGKDEEVAVSSLPYTFIDGRFVNDSVGTLSKTDFDDEEDLSCILVYEDGDFKRLNNSFPTMYYEDGFGLCWKVNGHRTGLPVQGIPGKDGKNSDILIVKINKDGDGLKGVDIYGKGLIKQMWTKTGNWQDIDNPKSLDGYSCFALAPSHKLDKDGNPVYTEDENGNRIYEYTDATSFYAGKLVAEGDDLYVICKPELSLQQTFGAAVFIEAMQNISLIPNSDQVVTPPGLFVPMKSLGNIDTDGGVATEPQPIHLISATSINNLEGGGEYMTDMIMSPMNTIKLNALDKDINVSKYLYVKMSNDLLEYVKITDRNHPLYNVINKDTVLKYKLSDIVLDVNNVEIPHNVSGGIYMQMENAHNNIGVVDDDRVVYVDDNDNRNEYVHLIPNDYVELVDNRNGFYEWELDITSADYDPANTYPFNYSEHTIKDDLIFKHLKHVYTKTMTPGITDDILFLNSLTVDFNDYSGKNVNTRSINTFSLSRMGYGFDEIECPTCGYQMTGNVQYCGNCGEDVHNPSEGGYCAVCQAPIPSNSTSCWYCGWEGVCPVCGLQQYSTDKKCDRCGANVLAPGLTKTCTCGATNPIDRIRCWSCGGMLTKTDDTLDSDGSDILIPIEGICHFCGNSIYNGTCSRCGWVLSKDTSGKVCARCGKENHLGRTSCWNCSSLLAIPEINTKVCPVCGTMNSEKAIKCECGHLFDSFQVLTKECPKCHTNNLIDDDVCTECGHEFNITYMKCPGCGTECSWHVDTIGVCDLCGYDFGVGEGKTCPNCDTVTDDVQLKNCEECNYNFYTHVVDVVEPEKPADVPKVGYKLYRGTDRTSLKFEKFVPVYNNEYRMNRDSALNINYNVNITGDETNSKHNLSVHGDINCENINVYELAATGKINNIYTEDDIVGLKGIKLAYNKFVVDHNGNAVIGDINAGAGTFNTIHTGSADFSVSSDDSVPNIIFGESNNKSNAMDVVMTNIDKIAISRANISSVPPVIKTDIPTVAHTGSGIYVTNDESAYIPYIGVSDKSGGKVGVLTTIDKVYDSFKKNFTSSDNTSTGTVTNNSLYNKCTTSNAQTASEMSARRNSIYIGYQAYNDQISAVFDGDSNTIKESTKNPTDSQLKQQSCCSFYVPGKDFSKMDIKFNYPLQYALVMLTSCSNGNWTLIKADSSWVKLKLFFRNSLGKVFDITSLVDGADKKYTISADNAFNGYEQLSKSGNARWREYVRTEIFRMYPTPMVVDYRKLIDNNVDILGGGTIYVTPVYSFTFKTQDNRKLINNTACSKFIPIKAENLSNKNSVTLMDDMLGVSVPNTDIFRADLANTLFSSSAYITIYPTSDSNSSVTSVVNDGILVNKGGAIISMGVENNTYDPMMRVYQKKGNTTVEGNMNLAALVKYMENQLASYQL